MTYQDQINELFKELPAEADYYVKIRALLNYCYQNQYDGNPAIVSDLPQLKKTREKKKNEGRSTKSVLSATDSQVYVLNDIWKRLARKEHDKRTLDRARLLLDHFGNRADKRIPKLARGEYIIIDQLQEALDKEAVTIDLLESPDVAEFLSDINPYKSLEGYLNDAENLHSKTRSKWRQELPFLLVVLGFDLALLKEYLQNETSFLRSSGHEQIDGNPTNKNLPKWKSWNLQYWASGISLVIVTILTISLLWNTGDGEAEARTRDSISESKKMAFTVESPISDYLILGPYIPFSTETVSGDSITTTITSIQADHALIEKDTIPLNEMYLEILIQNSSKASGYVFEGLELTTLQNLSISQEPIQFGEYASDDPSFQIKVPCEQGTIRYYTISNPTNRVLKPGQETLFRVKITTSGTCDQRADSYRIVPFRVGFSLQNVRGSDIDYELTRIFKLGQLNTP